PAFGGQRTAPLAAQRRREVASALMPLIRGRIGRDEPKIGHFEDSDPVLEFVDSHEFRELAALGTSCPDHFLRTKIRPLVIDFDPERDDAADAGRRLDEALEAYRAEYRAYYERWATADSPPMRDPNPVVYLMPGVGMFTFAKDKKTARVAGEFYLNAINVMREANRVDRYVGLSEQEAFNIEYWELEEAKLRRQPPPKSLAGRVALVTGGAGGIGEASARRMLDEGACVVLTDRDEEGLERARAEIAGRYGDDMVRSVTGDVTDEGSVDGVLQAAAREYGGLDILVSNAGIASSAGIEDTSLELWERNFSVLGRGYFLASRAAFRLMKTQDLGGAMVFIGSKNGLAASGGAAAYCAAKASELHLARCLALEGGPHGIRVNVVNPDAVLRGSKIWSGDWRRERAAAYHIDESELEAFYRDRSLLKKEVLPEDIAEAVYFLASPKSAKSTGNIVNVDAGNAGAFTR
ncbi:MAG TPA: bifunctional rhamnulose-1-phosphate aldolase/short-chain dehydrogenase, partial [Gammaproteobacteria bacterium]|nr:bifunctional rhamnulose-1-phosphate aldolase/short-chain dehydrogenase [Gammaproteobacteria bacterium]